MNNTELVTKFYTAFQQKDYKTMQELYADQAVFNDAVFIDLSSKEVRAMWQMLLTRGKDLTLEFKDIWSEGNKAGATWIATYTFSGTGNKVTNHIKAVFEIEAGKIVKHTDSFSFYKWARQALGIPGLLLGWSSVLKNKVQRTAKENLQGFMK
ncbi:MAG: nuclear transport factor 2 family protein [Bacteroidota bacterium]